MALSWISAADDGALLRVFVQPRAGRTEIVGPHDGALKIRLAAPPVDGAANRALVTFLAKELGIPKTSVEVRGGHSGRRKKVSINGLEVEQIREKLIADA